MGANVLKLTQNSREIVRSVGKSMGLAVVAFPLGSFATLLLKSRGVLPNKKESKDLENETLI